MFLYNNSIRIKPYWAQIEGTRGKQEDSANWYYYSDGSGGCAILADGIGGGGDGDKASKTVVAAFMAGMERYGRDLRKALKYANGVLKREKESFRVSNTKGCGCTLVAVSIVNGWLSYISVGDSHLFLHKKGRPLGGTINYHHSGRGSKITSAVTGFYELVEPGTEKSSEQRPYDCQENFARFEPGDRLVLASDGLDTYEKEKGRYHRLEKLLAKYPVGGEEADAQTIVTHILNELEMDAGRKLEMARAQLWTPEQIVTLQDNATILLVEAFPASQEQNVAPVSPRVVPPEQQTRGAKKKRVAREDNTAPAGVGAPIFVEQTAAVPAPPGKVEQGRAKEIRNSMDWRKMGLGAAVALGCGIVLGGLVFSGGDSGKEAPQSAEKAGVGQQGTNSQKQPMKTENAKSSEEGKQSDGNAVGGQQGTNSQKRQIDGLNNEVNRLTIENTGLKNALEGEESAKKVLEKERNKLEKLCEFLVEASLKNVKPGDKIQLLIKIADLSENPQIRGMLIKELVSGKTKAYDGDSLKTIGENKADKLWEIVVADIQRVADDIQTKPGDVLSRIPDSAAEAPWGGKNDAAPNTWQLLRYMAALKKGETPGNVSDDVLGSMGEKVKEVCVQRLTENQAKKKQEKIATEKKKLQEALASGNFNRIKPVYYSNSNELPASEKDGLVKDWLSKKDDKGNVLGLEFDRLVKCVENNEEKFIELALQVVEARLPEPVGESSAKAKDIYAPLKEAAGFNGLTKDQINDFNKKLLGGGPDSSASRLRVSLWLTYQFIEGAPGIITESENKITNNWKRASAEVDKYRKIKAVMEAVIDALEKERLAQQVQ